jgi:hypothetical protein
VKMTIGDEPAKGARIQFKTPDGKRIVRRFDPAGVVKTIYAFVAVSALYCAVQYVVCVLSFVRCGQRIALD